MTSPRLSAQQTRVVEHEDGAMLVVAGPGSGKTRVLTERIRRILTTIPGHFRVLALTFTNKAANEMKERLTDLGEARQRAFIGNIHSFCLEMLAERGKLVGVDDLPHIFEQYKDRKEILLKAVLQEPRLAEELDSLPDAKSRNQQVDKWLQGISWIKAHPISCAEADELDRLVVDAYDAGLRACGAYDFDDLLLLAYRLLSGFPKIADFYRRLYRFICIDEAQDLNEAQYAVLEALCGTEFRNVMMVGDPKQSIYGFNTSSPEFMWRFRDEFKAQVVEFTENFRSSRAVVDVARALDPKYQVQGQLPVEGSATLLVGADEADEARQVVDEIEYLMTLGHHDVEGAITPSSCAILGRTRFALMVIENELRDRGIPYYKRLTPNHENESDALEDLQLGLRVLANPRDRLHLAALAKRWKAVDPPGSAPTNAEEVLAVMGSMATASSSAEAAAVVAALQIVGRQTHRLDLIPAIKVLQLFADKLPEADRIPIYEDSIVLTQEWDQYLRSDGTSRSIAGFMSSKALGGTQQASRDGVALLTVHSSKGLEFDVVFIAGMAEGIFPDYRALGKRHELEEETRNAFVAATRSKRLLYFSYPRKRRMPWGDTRIQQPSRFLAAAKLTT